MPSLRQRRLTPELMDDPALDPAEHRRALAALGRINRWSNAAGGLWPRVRRLAREVGASAGRPLRVLDVASGGGDVALGLWRRGERHGIPLEVFGLDFSPTAIASAELRVPPGARVSFRRADVLAGELPPGFDLVVSTLFLHHLTQPQATSLLAAMARAAERCVLVSDLRRSLVGYALAHVACRVLTRSPVVRIDGPRSVEGAFTRDELLRVAAEAGLAGATLRPAWPQRLLLEWHKDPPAKEHP
ncbi:MAG: methyltransferase domain-containing protein [Lacipirellulaceae bacterium]